MSTVETKLEDEENTLRIEVEERLLNSENFSPTYRHLDTLVLMDKVPLKGNYLLLASRPFSNINSLRDALHTITKDAKTVVVKSNVLMGCSCGCTYNLTRQIKIRDANALKTHKNTFNGPALIPHLLPPGDILVGKLAHPLLPSCKVESWKKVCGKLEAFRSIEVRTDLRKKKEIKKYETEFAESLEEFVTTTLTSFEVSKGYPGGPTELHTRCFSLYLVKHEDGAPEVAQITWMSDYTWKSALKTWSKKSLISTVPIPPYLVNLQSKTASWCL